MRLRDRRLQWRNANEMTNDLLPMAQSARTNRLSPLSTGNGNDEAKIHSSAASVSNDEEYDSDGSVFAPP